MKFKLLKYVLILATIYNAPVIAMQSNINVSDDSQTKADELKKQAYDIMFLDTALNNEKKQTEQEELVTISQFVKQFKIPNTIINDYEMHLFTKYVLPNIRIENFCYVLTALANNNNKKENIDSSTFSPITALLYYYLYMDDAAPKNITQEDICSKYWKPCNQYNKLLLSFINKYFMNPKLCVLPQEIDAEKNYYKAIYETYEYLNSNMKWFTYESNNDKTNDINYLNDMYKQITSLESVINNNIGYSAFSKHICSFYRIDKVQYYELIDDYKKLRLFIQEIDLVNLLNKCILLYNQLFRQKPVTKNKINSFVQGESISNLEYFLIYKALRLRKALDQSSIADFQRICPKNLHDVFKLFTKILQNHSELYQSKQPIFLNNFKEVMHAFLGDEYYDDEMLCCDDSFSDLSKISNTSNIDNTQDLINATFVENDSQDTSNLSESFSHDSIQQLIYDIPAPKNNVPQLTTKDFNIQENYLENNDNIVNNLLQILLMNLFKDYDNTKKLIEEANSDSNNDIIAMTFGCKSYDEILNKINLKNSSNDIKDNYNTVISIAKSFLPIFRAFILSILEIGNLKSILQDSTQIRDAKNNLFNHIMTYDKFYNNHYKAYSDIYNKIKIIKLPDYQVNASDIQRFKNKILNKCKKFEPLSDVLKTIFIKNNLLVRTINPDKFGGIELIIQYIYDLVNNKEIESENYTTNSLSLWANSKTSDQLLLPIISFFFQNIQQGEELINTLEKTYYSKSSNDTLTADIMNNCLNCINYKKYLEDMQKIINDEDVPTDEKLKKELKEALKKATNIRLQDFREMRDTLFQIQLGKSLRQFVLFLNELYKEFFGR